MSSRAHTLEYMSDLPPAGWYDDPEGAGNERWWNGVAWAEDRRPVQQAPVFAPPSPYQVPSGYVVGPAPSRKNGMATTGLVLTLVSLLLNPFAIMSILGIVFGAVGLGRSKEMIVDGKQVGRSASLWAIWLGIISVVLFVIQFQAAMQGLERAISGI